MAKGIHDSRYRWVIERLVEERKTRHLSQAKLANLLDQPQQYVSRYETGERRLDIFEFIDAASAPGIDGLELARSAGQT